MGDWHEGEKAMHDRVGFRNADELREAIFDSLTTGAARFLAGQTLAMLGTVDADGWPWASALAGNAGFLQAVDPRTLHIAASAILDHAAANHVRANPQIGLLAIDLSTRRRFRLNGRATIDADGGLRVSLDEVYGNCQKYIQRRVAQADPPTASAEFIAQPTHSPKPRDTPSHILTENQQQRIKQADTFLIASHHQIAGADISHRGGRPGFVGVEHLNDNEGADRPTRLLFPDYRGNLMFQTLGNLLVNPRAGLLFPDFDGGPMLQLSGTAKILADNPGDSRMAHFPGAQRLVEFTIRQVVESANPLPVRLKRLDYSPFLPDPDDGR